MRFIIKIIGLIYYFFILKRYNFKDKKKLESYTQNVLEKLNIIIIYSVILNLILKIYP